MSHSIAGRLGHSLLPAVHHSSSGARGAVDVIPHSPDKLDQRLGSFRDAVIRPHRVVEMTNHPADIHLVLLVKPRVTFIQFN